MAILTEQQATQKWCPFSRSVVADADVGNDSTVAFNRIAIRNTPDARIPAACACIGSGCAAWEWYDSESGWTSDNPRRGYCGLLNRERR